MDLLLAMMHDRLAHATARVARAKSAVRAAWLVWRESLRAHVTHHVRREALGYAIAVLGVVAASLAIGTVQRFVHVSNISLLYLFVVLYLARQFGRWPAVLASLLAFLAYDFLFIPPLYHFAVDDPAEWVSLAALLVSALVLGELTATVEARRREAVESQRRTATLYALAQLIASARDEQALFDALAQRVIEVFGETGVQACVLILADGGDGAAVRAAAPASGPAAAMLDLSASERKARVRAMLVDGRAANGRATLLVRGTPQEMYWRYVPLYSGERIVGVLGTAGGPDIAILHVEPVTQAVALQRGQRCERRRSGTRRHEAIHAAPHGEGNAEGNAQASLFAAFCDQIALALERATLRREAVHAEALRESDKLKTALLGSVTHDLRTPLAAIKAATGSLLEQGASWRADDRRDLLESIDASANRLDRLVSNLLDLSRLEGGVGTPQKDWYPIGDVLSTVLDQLDLTGQTRNHQIEVDVAPGLPLVAFDYPQLEEVFTNLLENAMKYSPSGSTIHVQARLLPDLAPGRSPAELEVRVTDRGIGIPASELQAIFDKFYRVQLVRLPWANRPPIGTGLGLAICDGIIRAHGGRIWAESQLGEGSTFIITLPIPAQHPAGSLPEVGQPAFNPAPPSQADGSAEVGEASAAQSEATL